MIDLANMLHPSMRDLAIKRLSAADYAGFLDLFGSHERWDPLLELLSRQDEFFDDSLLPKLFHDVWIAAKNLPYPDALDYLIGEVSWQCPKTFTRSDRAVWSRLPEQFTAFRGFSGPNEIGRSWTLSEDVAVFFADRLRADDRPAIILTREIRKEDVLFYTNERDEREVVTVEPMTSDRRRIVPESVLVMRRDFRSVITDVLNGCPVATLSQCIRFFISSRGGSTVAEFKRQHPWAPRMVSALKRQRRLLMPAKKAAAQTAAL